MFLKAGQSDSLPLERTRQGRNELGNNKCSAYRQYPGRGGDMEEK